MRYITNALLKRIKTNTEIMRHWSSVLIPLWQTTTTKQLPFQCHFFHQKMECLEQSPKKEVLIPSCTFVHHFDTHLQPLMCDPYMHAQTQTLDPNGSIKPLHQTMDLGFLLQ